MTFDKLDRPVSYSCSVCSDTMRQLGGRIVSVTVPSKRHIRLSSVVSIVDSVCRVLRTGGESNLKSSVIVYCTKVD